MTNSYRSCFLLLLISVTSLAIGLPAGAAAPYQFLEQCRLIPNPANDGDSFHVRALGKEFIFRSFYVDTPETDMEFPERVREQAKYFGITPDEAVRVGKMAAQFTRNQLAKPFSVRTRWQNARGRSSLPRYYAHIMIGDQTLAELLVANGLARIFGEPAVMPNGTPSYVFVARLRALEGKAKNAHLGAWSLHAPKTTEKPDSSWDKFFPKQPAPAAN